MQKVLAKNNGDFVFGICDTMNDPVQKWPKIGRLLTIDVHTPLNYWVNCVLSI